MSKETFLFWWRIWNYVYISWLGWKSHKIEPCSISWNSRKNILLPKNMPNLTVFFSSKNCLAADSYPGYGDLRFIELGFTVFSHNLWSLLWDNVVILTIFQFMMRTTTHCNLIFSWTCQVFLQSFQFQSKCIDLLISCTDWIYWVSCNLNDVDKSFLSINFHNAIKWNNISWIMNN